MRLCRISVILLVYELIILFAMKKTLNRIIDRSRKEKNNEHNAQLIAKSGSLSNLFRHRFSTKYFDAETGLYYYGYRFYSPQLMRWMNRDPIDEDGGINLYVFCRNIPVEKTDFLGLFDYCSCVEIKEFKIRYKKAWWKYLGWPFGLDKEFNNPYKLYDADTNIKKKRNCDTAYLVELNIEPSNGRNALLDDSDPGNANDNPCKLRTGRMIAQNFGPDRAEYNYYPVVKFAATTGDSKIIRLWGMHNNMEGRYGINSYASFLVYNLPERTRISITVDIHTPEETQRMLLKGNREFSITLE